LKRGSEARSEVGWTKTSTKKTKSLRDLRKNQEISGISWRSKQSKPEHGQQPRNLGKKEGIQPGTRAANKEEAEQAEAAKTCPGRKETAKEKQ
jgi:hypothetical protein